MKTAYLASVLAVAGGLLLFGCGDDNPLSHCPAEDPPGPFGPERPAIGHYYPTLSPDGRQLAYVEEDAGSIHVLDLTTGTSRMVDIESQLPANVGSMGCGRVAWCPYDNMVLMTHCADITDTGSVSPKNVYGQNYYRVSLVTGAVQRVTPSTYGPAGSKRGMGRPLWLSGSTPLYDSILTQFSESEHPGSTWKESGMGVYVPQIDSIVPTTYPAVISQSRNGRHLASVVASPDTSVRLFVDGLPLTLNREYYVVDHSSWSPDESRLALSMTVAGGNHQLWIVDVDRWLRNPSQQAPLTVIDLRARHCKLNRRGINAAFVTNTTLAVSMHDPGDEGSYLWEIRDDGTILRQLTSK